MVGGSTREESTSKVSRMHSGRILPPEDCCTEDLSSLQVVAGDLTQFLALEPLHWVVYNRITFTILSLSEKSHLGPVHSHQLGSHLRNCLPPSGCHSYIFIILFLLYFLASILEPICKFSCIVPTEVNLNSVTL